MSSPPFSVGDLVVQYRYFTTEGFVEGQRPDQAGAVWRVLEIGPAFVLMELVSGRYLSEYDDTPWKDPGHTVAWETSDLYRMRFPHASANQQTFDQYRRVEPTSR